MYATYYGQIKVWDIRCEDVIRNYPIQTLDYPPNKYQRYSKLILNEPYQLLAGSSSLMGILEFDLRTLEPIYHQVHDYPLSTLDQGTSLFSDLIVSSGKAPNFDIKLNVYKPNSLDTFTVFEGHKRAITCVGISDNFIASGALDGGLRVMKFLSDKKTLKAQGRQITINSH